VVAQVHASIGPSIEVCLDIHGTLAALVLADRPVLVEGLGAVDGWLLHAGRLADLVAGAVGGKAAALVGVAAGVVGAVLLDDVVFDQGVAGPAVDGQVAVALDVEVAAEVDRAACAGVL
jgi:hypothetical protein